MKIEKNDTIRAIENLMANIPAGMKEQENLVIRMSNSDYLDMFQPLSKAIALENDKLRTKIKRLENKIKKMTANKNK